MMNNCTISIPHDSLFIRLVQFPPFQRLGKSLFFFRFLFPFIFLFYVSVSTRMVVATSTAVATSSSSAVPTTANAAPRYFFNSVFFAASVYGLINSIILSKKRIKFNFVIYQMCCSRGFEVGKSHSAAPLVV
jgi:hypothetical protein